MKPHIMLLGLLCAFSQTSINADLDAKKAAELAEKNALINLAKNDPKKLAAYGIAGIGFAGAAYWMVKNGKDLFKSENGILPIHMPEWFKGKDFLPTLSREAATAVLYTIGVVALKTIIGNQFDATTTGDGKSSNVWVERAWGIGTSLAFARLAWEIGKRQIPGYAQPSALFDALRSKFNSTKSA